MTSKILLRWLLLVVTPFVIGISLYRFLVGPISPYVQLATPLIFLALVPITYLSMDSEYIQNAYFSGWFGEANAPIKNVVTIPGGVYQDIDIGHRKSYLSYLNRWAIFRETDHPVTILYDRLTKKWYYHYQPSNVYFKSLMAMRGADKKI